MEPKRYFFKLEMEQLPDDIWHQVKSSAIVEAMNFQNKSEVVDLIEQLSEPDFDKLRHTVRAIRDEADLKFIKEHPEKFEWLMLSQSSFAEDWLSPEDEEAWKDL